MNGEELGFDDFPPVRFGHGVQDAFENMRAVWCARDDFLDHADKGQALQGAAHFLADFPPCGIFGRFAAGEPLGYSGATASRGGNEPYWRQGANHTSDPEEVALLKKLLTPVCTKPGVKRW